MPPASHRRVSAGRRPVPGRASAGPALAWPPAAVFALLGVLLPLALVLRARATNGFLGLPLDDAWIHLNYARTLAEHGRFAYHPDAASSAGSTSPLFTLLEAVGLLVTDRERWLAIGLGVAAQALLVGAFARWARRLLGDAWAMAAVLFVALDGRVALLASSGMETSLFTACVALAFIAHRARRPLAEGLAVGAAVWVRPDGLVLAAVLGIDRLIAALDPRGGDDAPAGARRSARTWALAVGALLAAYVAFEMALGHTPLPNTFEAKHAFYAGRPRLGFLRDEVLACVTGGGWWVLLPFALFVMAREAGALARGRAPRARAEAGWAVALPLAYLALLPYAHRFQRYLVPALPALALLGFAGLRDAARALAAWRGRARVVPWAAAATVVAALAFQLAAVPQAADEYALACRYHELRHVATGRWLATHTPPDAVIATHDIGAIAYYSRRRIVDVAGLVDPEVIPHLDRPEYLTFLENMFARRGVTHLAVFSSWIDVDNVSALFVADPHPEVLQVFPWKPGLTHLVPEAAAQLAEDGLDALRRGDARVAVRRLEQAVTVDSLASRSWYLLGGAYERTGRVRDAARAWQRSLRLNPGLDYARRHLAALEAERLTSTREATADEPGRPGTSVDDAGQ